MLRRAARTHPAKGRRGWPTPSMVVAGVALFLALGGSAVAATLINTRDIATGAVTSDKIRNGAIKLNDLHARTRTSLHGATGADGSAGSAGSAGSPGAKGSDGASGASGASGANGANGPNGVAGANGASGANGPNGPNGLDGTDGIDGTNGSNGAAGANGTNGTAGTNGTDGVIAPLSAIQGPTALPTATPPTVVVQLTVPSGDYVVLAKTQMTHSGAGDRVDCVLKAGTTAIDQVSMATLPALAAIPMSLQAVAAPGTTQLSVECDVTTANGSASSSSLIAIPIG